MPAPWFVSTGLILVAMLCSAWAAEMGKLDANLEPLRPFLEKTYTGVFKSSTSEKPVVDVLRWERALNGKAVRSFTPSIWCLRRRDHLHVGRRGQGHPVSLLHHRGIHDYRHHDL